MDCQTAKMKKNEFYLKDSLSKDLSQHFDEETAEISNNLTANTTRSDLTINSSINTSCSSKYSTNTTISAAEASPKVISNTSAFSLPPTYTATITNTSTEQLNYNRDNLSFYRRFENQSTHNSKNSRTSSINFSHLKRIYNKKKPTPDNEMNQVIKVDINNNDLEDNKNVDNQIIDLCSVVKINNDNDKKNVNNIINKNKKNNNNNNIDNNNNNIDNNNNNIDNNNNNIDNNNNNIDNNNNNIDNNNNNIINMNNNDKDDRNFPINNNNQNNNYKNNNNISTNNNSNNNINDHGDNRWELESFLRSKVDKHNIHLASNHYDIDNFASIFTFRTRDKEEEEEEEDGGGDENNDVFDDEDDDEDDVEKKSEKIVEFNFNVLESKSMQEEIKKWRTENEKLKRKYAKIKQQCLLNSIKVDSSSEEEDVSKSRETGYDWCYKLLFETCLKRLVFVEEVLQHEKNFKYAYETKNNNNTETNRGEDKRYLSVDTPNSRRRPSSCPDFQKFAQITLLQLSKADQNGSEHQINDSPKASSIRLNLPDKSSFSRQNVQYRHIKPKKNLADRYSAEGIKNSQSFISFCQSDSLHNPSVTSTPRAHRRAQKPQIKSNYERLCTRRNGLGSLRLKDRSTSIINRLSAQNFTSYIEKT